MNNFILFAQTNFDDDVEDAPAAPIDDYLWVLALVGLLLAFMWFRSIQNKKINN
jgi:MYXO-CTERM domain-containing protein